MTKLSTLRFGSLALLATLLLQLTGCQHKEHEYQRGQSPWIFRSVLDLKPRVITLALHEDMWVAYDAEHCSLFKVWKEGVHFDGPVYTSAHGPQPTTEGQPYLVSPFTRPWKLIQAGDTLPLQASFKGHKIEHAHATLSYELSAPGVEPIQVQETPEYVFSESGTLGLERSFTVKGLPKGSQLVLATYLNALKYGKGFSSNSHFELLEKSEQIVPGDHVVAVKGLLHLKAQGKTQLSAWFYPDVDLLYEKPVEASATPKMPKGMALIERSDCKTCHNTYLKTVGPAYIEVAKKYRTTPLTIEKLANKVINGGGGVWGEAMMTAHHDLSFEDASEMVSYILSLDKEEPSEDKLPKGIAYNVFLFPEAINSLPSLNAESKPVASGRVPMIYAEPNDLKGMPPHTLFHGTGYVNIKRSGNYVFRLEALGGSQLAIGDQILLADQGPDAQPSRDAEVLLQAGSHKLTVYYYPNQEDKSLKLAWASLDNASFEPIPRTVFVHDPGDIRKPLETQGPQQEAQENIAGDGAPLRDVHPSFTLSQVRPDAFEPKVGGMDFKSDGSMVLSTWDAAGSIWLLENIDQPDPEQIQVTCIAQGLAEPLGVKVVEDEIYVLQKQELTQLIDHDGDKFIDEYRSVCSDWRVSANFHEFAFGLVYQDGYFYATLATAINPGGASTQPQIQDRGRAIRISKETGELEFIAHGLRTPNGIGVGLGDEIFIADNQGDWLPASKIVHLQEGAWYGSRSVDFAGTANLTEAQPVVWLPQDDIGNSPSQPAKLEVGPYKNQLIHGEVTHGGIKRVFVEKINGIYQGCVFRFTQGLEAGVNRLIWGPDNALYIGGIGSTGNWQHYGKKGHGLQKMTYNGNTTFEMLAVRAKSDGIEIEFTEPLKAGHGENVSDYQIDQWWYLPTAEYGGPKMDEERLGITKLTLSPDRKRVHLQLSGMKPKHVVYVRLNHELESESGQHPWTTEAWYTLTQVPSASAVLAQID